MKSPSSFENKVIHRNRKMGEDACEILATALNAVDPYACVRQSIQKNSDSLIIGKKNHKLDRIRRIFIVGFGKASVPMAKALIDSLDGGIDRADVITKDKKFLEDNGYEDLLTVHLGSHPVPTKESVKSTRSILNALPDLTENDLVLVVISGGGSALFVDPYEGISLDDLQSLTDLLLKSGADIKEINTIRKHLDKVKGGRFASALAPAIVHALILSDVVGDHLDMIASGPTVPDPTTYDDAIAVLQNYGLEKKTPSSVMDVLLKGREGLLPETLKPGEIQSTRVINNLVGTNVRATSAAQTCASKLGYHALIVSTYLTGQTKHVAEFIDGIIQTVIAHGLPLQSPACIIFGGETTVNVQGEGLGGRNMDLVLHMVPKLANLPGVLFISLGTDGEDGPTDAAGAVADQMVYQQAVSSLEKGINTYIKVNDSYRFFERVGGLIKVGSTGTNVNDLIVVLIAKQKGYQP